MNIIAITGRLTRDPELKTSADGKEYCKFSVAVDRRMQKDKADFFDCTAFGKQGVFVNQYFKKGSGVSVTGRMESNTVEKDGQKRTYWGISCDNVEFSPGSKKQNDSVPAGATVVQPDEDCPF